jgi:hypothetical protein
VDVLRENAVILAYKGECLHAATAANWPTVQLPVDMNEYGAMVELY